MALNWLELAELYPILKDVLAKVKARRISSQDMTVLLLLQLHSDINREFSGLRETVEGLKGIVEALVAEIRGMRGDFRPLIEAVAELIRSQARAASESVRSSKD